MANAAGSATPQPWVPIYQWVLGACTHLAKNSDASRTEWEARTKLLAMAGEFVAMIAVADLRKSNLRVGRDPKDPWYIAISMDSMPGYRVLVPFYLAADFPTGQMLDQLGQLSREVSLWTRPRRSASAAAPCSAAPCPTSPT